MFLQVRHNHCMDMQLLTLCTYLKRKQGHLCPIGKVNYIQKSKSIGTGITCFQIIVIEKQKLTRNQ